MSTLAGSTLFVLLMYYLWAMARPAPQRPKLVRGPMAFVIPLAIIGILLWVGR